RLSKEREIVPRPSARHGYRTPKSSRLCILVPESRTITLLYWLILVTFCPIKSNLMLSSIKPNTMQQTHLAKPRLLNTGPLFVQSSFEMIINRGDPQSVQNGVFERRIFQHFV
uniref:Uncharacterized protein n=1 Tax=Romanomermis culicivorax TaxID=13658 RepID=A0A915IZA7_ROMCU